MNKQVQTQTKRSAVLPLIYGSIALLIGFLVYGYSYIMLFGHGPGAGFELYFLQLFAVFPLLIIGGSLVGVGVARVLQRSNILTLIAGSILLLVDLLVTFLAVQLRPPGYGENETWAAVFAADFVVNAIALPLLIIGGVLVVRGLLRQQSSILTLMSGGIVLLMGFFVYGYSSIMSFEPAFLQWLIALPLLVIGGVVVGVGVARLLQRSSILTLISGSILLLVDLLVTFLAVRSLPLEHPLGDPSPAFAVGFVVDAIYLPLLIIGVVLVVRGLLRQRSNVLIMVGVLLLIGPLTAFIVAASYPQSFFYYKYLGPVEMVLSLLGNSFLSSVVVPVLVIIGLCLLVVGLRGISQTTKFSPTIFGPPTQPLQGPPSPPPSTVYQAMRDNQARLPAAVASTSENIPEPVEAITEAAPTLSTQQSLDALAPVASLLTPTDTPSIAPSPPVVTLPRRGLSRRTVIVGLGLAGLTAAGGGIAWWVLFPHPLYTYRGHSFIVGAVAWSPDGRRIASGDMDVQVWDATDGGHVFTYRSHSSYVHAVAWSPDGRRIASGGNDNTVQVWDAADGGHVFTYRGHSDGVSAVAWSPDGRRIASGDMDVQVWDAADGSHVFTYRGHASAVLAVVWSPDGRRIASGSYDVQVWDAADGSHAFTYRGHSSYVRGVAWSPDGRRIASGSNDETVQVWDAADGGHVFTYRGHSSTVNAVAWSPDGRRIASGSDDGTVQVWDAADGSHVFTYRGHSLGVTAVAWSPDNRRIASGSGDQTVQVWQTS
jgi:WD40 repeat protein